MKQFRNLDHLANLLNCLIIQDKDLQSDENGCQFMCHVIFKKPTKHHKCNVWIPLQQTEQNSFFKCGCVF